MSGDAMTTIPSAALTQHMAVLGKTGSGKSFMTRGLVEHLLGEGRRVCILDYTGAAADKHYFFNAYAHRGEDHKAEVQAIYDEGIKIALEVLGD